MTFYFSSENTVNQYGGIFLGRFKSDFLRKEAVDFVVLSQSGENYLNKEQ